MMDEALLAAADARIAPLLDAMGLQEGPLRLLVAAVCAQVKQQFPEARATLKYGGIQWAMPVPFCGIYAYSQHVSVELSHGATIPDFFLHLQGKGQYRRHLKLYVLQDISEQQLAHYLPLALKAALDAA